MVGEWIALPFSFALPYTTIMKHLILFLSILFLSLVLLSIADDVASIRKAVTNETPVLERTVLRLLDSSSSSSSATETITKPTETVQNEAKLFDF